MRNLTNTVARLRLTSSHEEDLVVKVESDNCVSYHDTDIDWLRGNMGIVNAFDAAEVEGQANVPRC